MATPAYMSITGTKQGLITAGAFTEDSVGNTYQEGHEDQVMVQGFNHEVIIPRDPGRRLSRDRRTRPASLAVVPSMTHSAVARKARAGSMPLCLL
ncbi:type VI secretion system tube protein TssD [Pseudomonas aeruginosa]|uniref:type VI secretion system tube protein TssD n=1 Tax=Pseudomonas aeruginosa TaxID=287 RepID=UPI0031BB6E58